MRRVAVPIKGAIPGDARTGQSYFTKPGTPLDKAIKGTRRYFRDKASGKLADMMKHN